VILGVVGHPNHVSTRRKTRTCVLMRKRDDPEFEAFEVECGVMIASAYSATHPQSESR
jgi:hypothetical protein